VNERRSLFDSPPTDKNDHDAWAIWISGFFADFKVRWRALMESDAWHSCGIDSQGSVISNYDYTPYNRKLVDEAAGGFKEVAAAIIQFERVWKFASPGRANEIARKLREIAIDLADGHAIDPNQEGDVDGLGWEIEDANIRMSTIPVHTPHYNPDTLKLSFDGKVVKIAGQARSWKSILAAFQDEGWPDRIRNPIVLKGANSTRACKDAAEGLNKRMAGIGIGFEFKNGGVEWRRKNT
jgi:hypothetical protein